MGTLLQDIRFGFRVLAKRPGFTIAAVLCLGLGIGVNSSIFSVVNSLFLRPPPVERPDRLVRMYTTLSKDFLYASVSYPDYLDYASRTDIFDGLFAHRPTAVSVTLGELPELAPCMMVSGNYFDVLGVRPAAGRFFSPEEVAQDDTHPVVVLGYGMWRRRFGGDPSAVGRALTVNGHPFTIVGVAPRGFEGLLLGIAPDLYAPINMQSLIGPGMSNKQSRGSRYLVVSGRLKDGLTLPQAQEAANLVGQRLQAEYPRTNDNARPLLIAESDVRLPPNLQGAALGFSGLAMAAVGLVLLIACANVANLLLARAAERKREISLRLAVGASRLRLFRQLLTESLLLSAAGGAVGLALASWVTGLLSAIRLPVGIPVTFDFSLDARVVGFSLAAALATGVVFGLAPALQAAKTDLVGALKGADSSGGPRRLSLGNLLVAGQMALSLLLLTGAGLFVRSLENAGQIDPGFASERVLLGSVDPSLNGYSEADGAALYAGLLERLRGLPGVQAAALAEMVPFGIGNQQNGVSVPGYQPAPDENLSIDYNIVSPGYFETVGIPLMAGRDFTPQDNSEAAPAIIVDEAFAARFFPGQDPIGKTVQTRGERTVVGLVKTIKIGSLGEPPKPYMYLPFKQSYNAAMTVHVKTRGDPFEMAPQLQSEVRALDPNLPVHQIRTLESQVGFSLFPARAGATALGVFALLAIALSGVGLYGILNYWVSRRTREIGIRVALGAERGRVRRMVVGRGLTIAAVGLAAGWLAAFFASRWLEKFLYGVSGTDPLTFAAVPAVLLLIALVACLVPASRALRVDPIKALRYE